VEIVDKRGLVAGIARSVEGKGRMSKMEQIRTARCSTATIMLHPHFERGLGDIRNGRPFADCPDDPYWSYERGRMFGRVAPRNMPLFEGNQLNFKAIQLFQAAYDRRFIL
jgi:hypothetical protein